MTDKFTAIVVLKGGPGSGHHGHKGIPGHQGGSLPRGESAARKPKEIDVVGEVPEEYDIEVLKAQISELSKEFGYPINKFSINFSKGSEFMVGNSSYTTAANYDPRTGTITLYEGSLSDYSKFNKSMIIHEISHARFHMFQKIAQRQEAFYEKTGSCGEEGCWALDIWNKYYHYRNARTKLFENAVTDYGKSYIDTALTSEYGVDYVRAVDENLAEVAGSAFSSGDKSYSVNKLWHNLYTEINEAMVKYNKYATYPQATVGVK